jgi:hypothetical protein
MSNAARGTFEELLNGTAPELADIARRLREAIFAVDPAAVETVRLGDNAATYGVGPKKMTEGYASGAVPARARHPRPLHTAGSAAMRVVAS